jgi:hypothetical protein
MIKGFVYVFSNPALSGLVKIGYTIKIPNARAVELEGTGVPAPFIVEYYCLVEDAPMVEATVHKNLGVQRYSAGREFFRVSVSEAIKAVEFCAGKPEHSWRLTSASPKVKILEDKRPIAAPCPSCGAAYAYAKYCPKCRVKLIR